MQFTLTSASRAVDGFGARQRRLVLVDIENMLGRAIFTEPEVALAESLIESMIGPTTGELVTVATSHMGMFQVHCGLPGARLLVQSGPDGADLKLLGEMTHPDISQRFTDLVLVSGDGIFTEPVARLTAQGVKVTVVAPIDGCSRRLEMAATEVLTFDRTTFVEGDAA